MNASWLKPILALVPRRTARSCRPELEGLGDRITPAGNVNVYASPDGTALTLTGDQLGNDLLIRSGQSPNDVVVSGIGTTTVNGKRQTFTFNGVESVSISLGDGNDSLQVTNLRLSSAAGRDSTLFVDAGGGDDRVELVGTALRAGGSANIQVRGEEVGAGARTSGNDTIRLIRVTVTGSSAGVEIMGEENTGGEVTGGNDTILVTNAVISATGPSASLNIYGDSVSVSGTGSAARVGVGNDSISVASTVLSCPFDTTFTVYGESVTVSNTSGTPTSAAATVGVGNDTIAVTKTAVSGTSSATVLIWGDYAMVDDNSATGAATATVGVGSDSIAVTNTAVSSNDVAELMVYGDYALVMWFSGTATVGVGDDSISITDTTVVGPSILSLLVYGDYTYAFDPDNATVGRGYDNVMLRNVAVIGPAGFFSTTVDTGVGNDALVVQGSVFANCAGTLGGGDDSVRFLNNTFDLASLDGGPGYDRLSAHRRKGLLWDDFEEVNVTP